MSRIVELKHPRQLTVCEEKLELDKLGPTKIAAKTLFTVISPGTELSAYRGDPPLRPSTTYPRLVGYCNVAEVVALGGAVDHYRVGDRILTFQSHRSAFVCAEKDVVLKVPTEMDVSASCTTYLFHLGYNALLKGHFQPGHYVGIVGVGTLGLCAVAVSSAVGAPTIAFTNQPQSQRLAKTFGAVCVFEKAYGDATSGVSCLTHGTGLDIVIVTSNEWSDWKLALQLVRKGGTICVIGFPGRNDPIPPFNPLDSQYFYDKQLTLISCGQSPEDDYLPEHVRFTVKRNCAYLLGLIKNRKLPATDLIASVHLSGEIEMVYKRMDQREFSPRTCVLDWS